MSNGDKRIEYDEVTTGFFLSNWNTEVILGNCLNKSVVKKLLVQNEISVTSYFEYFDYMLSKLPVYFRFLKKEEILWKLNQMIVIILTISCIVFESFQNL